MLAKRRAQPQRRRLGLMQLAGLNSSLSFPRALHLKQWPSTDGDSSVAATSLTTKTAACCLPPMGNSRTTRATGAAKATTVESTAVTVTSWPGAHTSRHSTTPLGPQTQQRLTLIIDNMVVITIVLTRKNNKICQKCCWNSLVVAVLAH